jgi:hypothetical protein
VVTRSNPVARYNHHDVRSDFVRADKMSREGTELYRDVNGLCHVCRLGRNASQVWNVRGSRMPETGEKNKRTETCRVVIRGNHAPGPTRWMTRFSKPPSEIESGPPTANSPNAEGMYVSNEGNVLGPTLGGIYLK